MEHNANNRLQALAAICVLKGGNSGAALADYLPDSESAVFLKLTDVYKKEPECEFKMQQIVRRLFAAEKFSSLSEIHPAWILEKLVQETPRIIGIILRSLPSKHVRFILKNLPPMLRAQIPDMVESFAVPAQVLNVIRSRFERHFLPMRVSRSIRRFEFEHLYYLKGAELEELIRDLGLTELAVALSDLPGKALHMVLNRLSLKEAKRLQRRMRELKALEPELVKQSRYAILDVEGDHIGPDKMLMRAGFAALASAIGGGPQEFVRLIEQRLDPKDGYLLRRNIDDVRMRTRPELVDIRRKMVLDAVRTLSIEGRIDALWGRFFDDTPIELGGSSGIVSTPSGEVTASVEQLA